MRETNPFERALDTANVAPNSMLEAGDEPPDVLMQAIAASLAEMAPGQILEVVSALPNAREVVEARAQSVCTVVLGSAVSGRATRVWVGKPWLEAIPADSTLGFEHES